ncbi:hypothetical protein SAMN05444159_6247 [Bradyrhizobium lablabi]|uniref:Uncharacterized protein n=1 Tax=Bradyrhizobium lablabi TaxID=722472 RepID=A0A1M7BQT1_9BRAD|nr:hypothetical protein SAMN05444159_6247 [Bradyrhizobium lablabi]
MRQIIGAAAFAAIVLMTGGPARALAWSTTSPSRVGGLSGQGRAGHASIRGLLK